MAIKDAVVEATVNALVLIAASTGLTLAAKIYGFANATVSYEFIALQAVALGLLRFSSYMAANEDTVSLGAAGEYLGLETHKGQSFWPRFMAKYHIGKLI